MTFIETKNLFSPESGEVKQPKTEVFFGLSDRDLTLAARAALREPDKEQLNILINMGADPFASSTL